MKENLTDVTVLVDRSGSMESIKSDMEGGFNTFLEDQKKESGDCLISLYTFDGGYGGGLGRRQNVLQLDTQYEGKNVQEAPPLSLNPRGCTPLWDAMGHVIHKTGERLTAMSEEQRPGRVILVVITDGLENSSVEYNGKQIKDMVSHQRDAYQWNVIYLGANQDAIEVGESLGTADTSSLTYAPTSKGVQQMSSSLSRGVSKLRSCSRKAYNAMAAGGQSVFDPEDYEDQKKADQHSTKSQK